MTDKQKEALHCLALSQIPGIGLISARTLFDVFGSATELFERREELFAHIGPSARKYIKMLENVHVFERAKRELEYAEKNGIECIYMGDKRYPSRLRECQDAPLVLFFKGKADLNALRMVSMVGTRNATDYGRELCEKFVARLGELCPDVTIVSGLAYGIDIVAHRSSLAANVPTIGVLAHGLDRIYPAVHRKTAVEMLDNGGLLTEYMSQTNPERQNFVQRNRIVAGLCDATVVVESAAKGGALITAGLAESYHRDCFAFPGRVGDSYSYGCNHLIRDNKAAIVLNADDFVKAMGWDGANGNHQAQPIQRQLFVDMTEEEERLMNVLNAHSEGMQINALVVEADIPINRTSALLFELEMKGMVKSVVGGVYKAI